MPELLEVGDHEDKGRFDTNRRCKASTEGAWWRPWPWRSRARTLTHARVRRACGGHRDRRLMMTLMWSRCRAVILRQGRRICVGRAPRERVLGFFADLVFLHQPTSHRGALCYTNLRINTASGLLPESILFILNSLGIGLVTGPAARARSTRRRRAVVRCCHAPWAAHTEAQR